MVREDEEMAGLVGLSQEDLVLSGTPFLNPGALSSLPLFPNLKDEKRILFFF